MQFEWDPSERSSILAKHGIDFVDVQEVFENEPIVVRSDRGGERRYTAVGKAGPAFIAVAYTVRQGTVRIISARKARSYERERYRALFER